MKLSQQISLKLLRTYSTLWLPLLHLFSTHICKQNKIQVGPKFQSKTRKKDGISEQILKSLITTNDRKLTEAQENAIQNQGTDQVLLKSIKNLKLVNSKNGWNLSSIYLVNFENQCFIGSADNSESPRLILAFSFQSQSNNFSRHLSVKVWNS